MVIILLRICLVSLNLTLALLGWKMLCGASSSSIIDFIISCSLALSGQLGITAITILAWRELTKIKRNL